MRLSSPLLAVCLATLPSPSVFAQPQPPTAIEDTDPDAPASGPVVARPVTRCVVGDQVGAFHQTSQLVATDCYRDCETEHRAWLTLPGFAKPVLELTRVVAGDAETSPFVVTCRKGRVSLGVRGLDTVPLELDRASGRMVVARALREEIDRAFAGEQSVEQRRWPASLGSVLTDLDHASRVRLGLANAREALRAGDWSGAARGSSWMHSVEVPGAVALARTLADQVRALRSSPPVRVVDLRVVSIVAGSHRHVFMPLWSGDRLCLRDLQSGDGVRCGAPPSFVLGAEEPRPETLGLGWTTEYDRDSERSYLWAPGLANVVFPGQAATGIPAGLRAVLGPPPRALVLDGTRFVLVGALGLAPANSTEVRAFLAQSQGSEFIGDRWIVHEDVTGQVLGESPGLSVSKIAQPGHEWRLVDGVLGGLVSPDGRWIAVESSEGGWDSLKVGRVEEVASP